MLVTTTPGLEYENLFWDQDTHILYWVDLPNGNVYKYDGNVIAETHVSNQPICCITPIEGNPNYFVIGDGIDLKFLYWDGFTAARLENFTTLDDANPKNRVNNGKCDRNNRLWIGTMANELIDGTIHLLQGALYLVTPENYLNPEVKKKPVSVSNGIAWNKCDNIFYYIDTFEEIIYAYDYQACDGDISNERIFFNTTEHCIGGFPGGLTIDTNDNLFLAQFGGGFVYKISTLTGEILASYPLPASQVTSVTWGGPELDILYVASGRRNPNNLTELDLSTGSGAGHIFAITGLGEKGFALNKFRWSETLTF